MKNAERPTPDKERRSAAVKFDLEDRLLDFAARVIRLTEKMKPTAVGRYVSDQLLRSGTSPYGHHGEAESAESRKDFVHKLRVCLKELREARRWMRLVQRSKLVSRPELLKDILTESDELIRIFVKSLQTASKITEGENLGR
jgi:four helix bundle protein